MHKRVDSKMLSLEWSKLLEVTTENELNLLVKECDSRIRGQLERQSQVLSFLFRGAVKCQMAQRCIERQEYHQQNAAGMKDFCMSFNLDRKDESCLLITFCFLVHGYFSAARVHLSRSVSRGDGRLSACWNLVIRALDALHSESHKIQDHKGLSLSLDSQTDADQLLRWMADRLHSYLRHWAPLDIPQAEHQRIADALVIVEEYISSRYNEGRTLV